MHDAAPLSPDDSEHLARILVEARGVRLRHQYFAWTQGAVQALIPHETLMLGLTDVQGGGLHERFNACRYFRDEHFLAVCRPGAGLLDELAGRWRQEREVVLLDEDDPLWRERLRTAELRNLAFLGAAGPGVRGRGYVCFARLRGALDARLALFAELLAPTLLAVLARVLEAEAEASIVPAPRAGAVISARELEILAWVRDGKTNDEIASILGLSRLTVKNHLFRAMKRLDVRTRGQAVARAIALGALSAHSPATLAGGRGG